MSSLETHIRALAPDGLRLHIWPTTGGRWQANVAERGGNGWTVVIDDDPISAAAEALRQRSSGIACRDVVPTGEPQQIDIEDVITDVPNRETVKSDTVVKQSVAFEDLLG